MRNLIILTAFFAVLTSLSPAQTARKVMFRTLCLEHADDIRTVVIPGATPEEVQSITLYSDLSPVVEGVFAGNEAAFYLDKPPGPDGKQVRELVGRTTLGKSGRQLLIFVPSGAGPGKPPYLVRSYDDDTSSFALGSVRAINMSPVPIRFLLSGELTPQIPPGKFAQFSHSKKVNDYKMYPAVVEFLSGSGEWVKGQSTNWKAADRRRDIVITTVDTRFKQPVVRMFADIPPWNGVAAAP